MLKYILLIIILISCNEVKNEPIRITEYYEFGKRIRKKIQYMYLDSSIQKDNKLYFYTDSIQKYNEGVEIYEPYSYAIKKDSLFFLNTNMNFSRCIEIKYQNTSIKIQEYNGENFTDYYKIYMNKKYGLLGYVVVDCFGRTIVIFDKPQLKGIDSIFYDYIK